MQVPEFLSHFLYVALHLSCFSVSAWLKDGAGGDCRGPRRNADPPTTNAPLLLQLFNAGFSTKFPFHCSQGKRCSFEYLQDSVFLCLGPGDVCYVWRFEEGYSLWGNGNRLRPALVLQRMSFRRSSKMIVSCGFKHIILEGAREPALKLQVVPGQAGGGSFKIETLIAYRAEQRLCLKVTDKTPVLRSNKLLTANLMPCLLNVGSFFISSDLIASQLLLEIVHCIPLSPQSVSSHLIQSPVFSPSRSSFLVTPILISSHVTWAFLIYSHLITACLSFSQIFTALLNSFSTLRSSCQLILCLLTSLSFSHIIWALLTSPQLMAALHLSSSSAHSQIISALLWPKTCSQNGSRRQSKRPLPFWQRKTFTHSKLFTQKHAASVAFTHKKLLHTEALHIEAVTQRSFHTEKPSHTEAFTHRSFYTELAFTQKSFYTQMHKATFYTEKPLHTASLYTEAFAHCNLLQR